MKRRRNLILAALAFSILLAGSAWAQNQAVCPPLAPNSGITSTIVPPNVNVSPAGCDIGFTLGTSMVILQGPVLRHFIKIQNKSTSGQQIGICFNRLETNTNACTMTNAGTVLSPDMPFYVDVAMYGGVIAFNSLMFNTSIEVIASSSGAAIQVTLE